jgi:DNA-binding NarL/FixJ family response regulator
MTEPTRETPQNRPVRILIADDHALMREGVRTILSNNPEWEICGEAEDGQEAVEKFRSLKPDLIILDISMPTLTGIAAARQIREMAPATKIVMLTMHESATLSLAARQAGANEVVTKRLASSALKAAIVRVLDEAGSQSQNPANKAP